MRTICANIIEENWSLVIFLQLGDIQSILSFLALPLPCRRDDDVEYADNQSIIFPAVCSTRDICHSGMLSVLPPHHGIVSELSMFGTWMYLGFFWCSLVDERLYW